MYNTGCIYLNYIVIMTVSLVKWLDYMSTDHMATGFIPSTSDLEISVTRLGLGQGPSSLTIL